MNAFSAAIEKHEVNIPTKVYKLLLDYRFTARGIITLTRSMASVPETEYRFSELSLESSQLFVRLGLQKNELLILIKKERGIEDS